MQERYERLRGLIAQSDLAEFGDYGEGVAAEWVTRGEERLGLKFPPTYVWWLENYGGGCVADEEIYSIYEQDFDKVSGGDIVHMHEVLQRQGMYPRNCLVVCMFDDWVFYFDLEKQGEDGEMPVYEYNSGQLYASDFVEFLEKRLNE